MITIEDLRNPAKQSGFDNVTANGRRTNWRASSGNTTTANGRSPGWRGPTRKSPEAAAQDYVDFVNLTRGRVRVAGRRRQPGTHPRRPRVVRTDRQPGGWRQSPAAQVARDIVSDARGWRAGQPGWIYLVAEHESFGPQTFVKVGGTVADPPERRLGDYQVGNPRRLVMVAKIRGTYADEKRLHEKYADDNMLGEWFFDSPALRAEFEEANHGS